MAPHVLTAIKAKTQKVNQYLANPKQAQKTLDKLMVDSRPPFE